MDQMECEIAQTTSDPEFVDLWMSIEVHKIHLPKLDTALITDKEFSVYLHCMRGR